ncbi:MAG: hypothetical protein RBS24_06855 [Bacilli bacterium]|nr:hypothetical protein [Bacilli bacterium]
MIKKVEIYELLERDYCGTLTPTGKFFTSYKEALKHKEISVNELQDHFALRLEDDSYLLLKDPEPIYLYNSTTERQKRVEELIGRLTPEEFDLLEEYFGCER